VACIFFMPKHTLQVDEDEDEISSDEELRETMKRFMARQRRLPNSSMTDDCDSPYSPVGNATLDGAAMEVATMDDFPPEFLNAHLRGSVQASVDVEAGGLTRGMSKLMSTRMAVDVGESCYEDEVQSPPELSQMLTQKKNRPELALCGFPADDDDDDVVQSPPEMSQLLARKNKPLMTLAGFSPDDEEAHQLARSYVSKSGRFSKLGFKIGVDGISDSPSKRNYLNRVKLSELKFGRTLGKGACGEVRLAEHEPSGSTYAVKCFDIAETDKRKQFMSEMQALQGDRCPQIVTLADAFFDEAETIYMALEFMDAGCLETLIRKQPVISEDEAAAVTYQILQGLRYLHDVAHQVHRDLKPGNVLVNMQGYVKISDFGLSRQLQEDEFATMQLAQTFVGTVLYLSPERMHGEPYNYSADVWALGIIVHELIHKMHPYAAAGHGFVDLLQTMAEELPEPDPSLSDPVKDFIIACCKRSPGERPGVGDLLGFPFVAQAPGCEAVVAWLSR